MSSSQELYDRLDEKLRELVHVKNSKTGDQLDLDHCGSAAEPIFQLESDCQLSDDGHQKPSRE